MSVRLQASKTLPQNPASHQKKQIRKGENEYENEHEYKHEHEYENEKESINVHVHVHVLELVYRV